MPPMKDLSPQLAARLGPSYQSQEIQRAGERGVGSQSSGRTAREQIDKRGGSDYSRLRGIIRSQKDQIQGLENEVQHFQSRLHRIEDGHRLELARLKKEAEYHKRLRQGADQRSYELEDRLARLQQQQQRAAASSSAEDEEKDGLIAQSQLLVSKNSELTYKLKTMEGQVLQLEELKAALESELNQAYCERDALAAELEHILSRSHHAHHAAFEAEDGEEDGGEAAGTASDEPPADGVAPA